MAQWCYVGRQTHNGPDNGKLPEVLRIFNLIQICSIDI